MAEDQEEDAPMQDAQDPEEELPELSLDIIDLIKTAQAQHGLRHGDYGRYRSYCSRRLHRLRRVTGCTHGKGRYVKRPLEPESVRDARQLMLPLFCAERAWAFAMQLKRENTQQEARPHYHLLARLAKAAEWSAKLAALCAERADQRTDLEAKAYSAFMHGNVALERENWAPALASFKSTATICTELARVTMAEQAALYKQVAAEVEPSIRFCSYNLRRLGGEEVSDETDAMGDDVDGLAGASDILRSKLEQVLAETRAKQAESLTEVVVLGERIPLRTDKTRLGYSAVQQALLEVQRCEEGGGKEAGDKADKGDDLLALYDKLFVACNDALDSVRLELRETKKREQSAKSGAAEASLLTLQAALLWQKLHHTARRNLLLLGRLREGKGPAGSRKRATPEDLVRLYDAVLATLDEMRSLHGYKENEALMGQLAARSAVAKAHRCYWVAESYGAVSKWREAEALYERAAALLSEAEALLDDDAAQGGAADELGAPSADCGGFGQGEDAAALAALAEAVEGAKARARARAYLASLEAAGEAPAEADGAGGARHSPEVSPQRESLSTPGQPATGPLPLLQRLDRFDAKPDEPLYEFPPRLEPVPCKPLLFDIARNQITYPDLGPRLQQQKGSTWGSWFSR